MKEVITFALRSTPGLRHCGDFMLLSRCFISSPFCTKNWQSIKAMAMSVPWGVPAAPWSFPTRICQGRTLPCWEKPGFPNTGSLVQLNVVGCYCLFSPFSAELGDYRCGGFLLTCTWEATMVSPAGTDLREENVPFWCWLPSFLQAETFLLTFFKSPGGRFFVFWS